MLNKLVALSLQVKVEGLSAMPPSKGIKWQVNR